MAVTTTISPTDPGYFSEHTVEALRDIVERYTADSLTMYLNGDTGPGHEALLIANNAWGELIERGEGA